MSAGDHRIGRDDTKRGTTYPVLGLAPLESISNGLHCKGRMEAR